MAGQILIVDDVATNRIMLKVRLTGACYDVLQAGTGQDALSMAQRERPDLIILDYDLPDISGTEICERLSNDPITRDIPVVMAIAQIDHETRISALRAGAEDYLTKPFDEMTLLARVRSLLRARQTEKELRLRDDTSRELGFAEAPPVFIKPAEVALIGGCPDAVSWKTALGLAGCRHRIRIVAPEDALAWPTPKKSTDHQKTENQTPDIFIIPGDLERQDGGLRLLSELRSRAATRHAGIIMMLHPNAQQQAIIALDLGANDLMAGTFDAEELKVRLDALATRKRRSDQLRNSVRDRLRLAMQDPLTGLFNRRYAFTHLARISDHADNSGNPFAVMMLDIDRFKQVNDTWGHQVGDKVLCGVAKRLQENMRDVDLVARIGGEEFLVAMPDTNLDQARLAAERIRSLVEEIPVVIGADVPPIHVTLSIGVSIGGVNDGVSHQPENLMMLADQALYASKNQGRNTVSFNLTAA
ncbi:diguanylate cyclase domain-containing protein [Halocynthiibacter namhaensis]|uniref:diguanylate cyclase domain-containing protein n=1 Tax=Halocynthiibacter namhaensis TaxID=1290553 RepID=UPI00057967CF|nr:diguanylate cyclase [Halocynthiibacter namhaensis]